MQDTFPISQKKARESFANRIQFEDHINDPYLHKPSAVNNIVTNIPIGSICWFKRTTAPDGWIICDGRWYSEDGKQTSSTETDTCTLQTPNLIDKYPLGALSGIGTEVAAGLPNIIGGFDGNTNDGDSYKTGSFYDTGERPTYNPPDSSEGANAPFGANGNPGGGIIGFDASEGTVDTNGNFMSKEDSPYGKSNTVTPPSVKLLPCMKIYNADTDDFKAYVDHEINEHANNTDVHFTSNEKISWANQIEGHIADTNLHYSGLPIGSVIWWSGLAENRPAGFLLLDGSTYDTTLYPELYAILGTNVLPNYIGRFIKGSTTAGVNEEAGIPEIYGQFSGVGQAADSSSAVHPYGEGAIRPAFAGNTTDNAVESKLGVLVQNSGELDDVYAFRASLGQLKSKYLDYTDKNLAGKHSVAFVNRDESVYGKSDTVTPENISAVPLIKAKHYAIVYAPGSLDETLRVEHNELKDTVNVIKQTAITTTKSSYTIDVYSTDGLLVGSTTCYCRVHSDGYKEMWGVIAITLRTGTTKFLLPESFSDLNYNVSTTTDCTYSALDCSVELDSFTLSHPQGLPVGYNVRWKASGY